MTNEHANDLRHKYPKLFRESFKGFRCDDGWYWILDAFCHRLYAVIPPNNMEDYFVLSIKEKFGQLRIIMSEVTSEVVEAVAAVEMMSTGVCEVCGAYGTLHLRTNWLKTLCEEHSEGAIPYANIKRQEEC